MCLYELHLQLGNDTPSFHPVHTQIRATGLRDLHHKKGCGLGQPMATENQWHWPSDTQLCENAHPYAQRNGLQALVLVRTLALNFCAATVFTQSALV